MYEQDESGVSRVPAKQLREFANSLFSYLYFYLNMQSTIVITSDYFKDEIGLVVFLIERITYKFNIDFVSDAAYIFRPPQLCENVCSSYPDDNYFKKLYYVSSFISYYMYWRHCALLPTDFNMGPDLWVEMFQRTFESQFERNGGWQGFADAGMVSLKSHVLHPNDFVSKETFLDNTFLARVALAISMRPKNNVISTNELAEIFEGLSLYGNSEQEEEEVEHDQQAQANEEINPLPSELGENVEIENPSGGTSEETRENIQQSPSRINERKRRHEPGTKNSDSERDTERDDHELNRLSVTPKRKKVQIVTPSEGVSEKSEEIGLQKTPRKRRHDAAFKDDKKLDSATSSKAKGEEK